jgi:hypothetical protein
VSKLLGLFSGFSLWARLVIIVALVALAIGVGVRLTGAIKYMIYGDVAAKREHAGSVVAQEQGEAAKQTGIEATNTVVHTYERHVEVDHVVKESQDAVHRADKGQQMDPAIDAAVAAGLCRLHNDLCRPGQR